MEPRDLSLTVWFDGDCGFCTRVARWLERQPKLVPVRCVAAQTAAKHGCPLDTATLLEKITVTASDGAVYRGTNAWITVLWALRNYRAWSLRLAGRRLYPWAEDLFAIVTGLARMTRRSGRSVAVRGRAR
jgi:predicted DCC family thiol-disulfide oxidoreductase YuxK